MRCRLAASVLASTALACQQAPSPAQKKSEPGEQSSFGIPTPAPEDTQDKCLDVAEVRVCFGPEPKLVPRPLPEAVDTQRFRCVGQAAERSCMDRSVRADAFSCKGKRCRQRHPRMPDDGAWECGDVAGVVACRGHAKTAGAPAGKLDPDWTCGPRRGHPKERLCLDFSPDLPPGDGPWSCHFEHEVGAAGRVCVKKASARVGQACAAAPCPAGTRCLDGRCLPGVLKTECWGDKDCPSGRCELTRCEDQP